jgi:hypothetical protein
VFLYADFFLRRCCGYVFSLSGRFRTAVPEMAPFQLRITLYVVTVTSIFRAVSGWRSSGCIGLRRVDDETSMYREGDSHSAF